MGRNVSRKYRNPDDIPIPHTVNMTESNWQTVKEMAVKLHMTIGEAISVLTQKWLAENYFKRDRLK